jgi:hypothetical protein
MRSARRVAGAVLGAAGWWTVSCRDIPAPADGVLSVSAIILPAPGLVAGDTLRDSTGLAAPLRVIAYDFSGDPLDPQPVPTFVVIDTGAHLVDGVFLVGDSVGRTVEVVGSVSGIQTLPASVKVTLAPDTLVASDSIVHHKSYTLISGDTIVNSAELATIVQHLGGSTPTGVDAVIVRYSIDRAPAGNGQGPTVLLLNGTLLSSRDTTANGGRASRVARLRLNALSAFVSDTVVVSATSSYRGLSLGTVQFTIIYTKQ